MFRRCPNCGGGPLQEFRELDDAEKEIVRQRKKEFPPEAYVRCARDGCRRFQRKLKWDDGGNFPE
ncbi:hypothetical protein QQY66_16170 [Streptomyces sp. DG2A-72]|uniref:hypothetical protein n=1 Tax=Streptomyces sp. DG2A-72 TaxID=3051386 RepID=UPI00265BF68E|nr:hypothetical protein [Streptomyces sp. DG2A-72]MDO0933153.1 hypothetical protein [Streptomyces sp. DG2A-72]